MNRDAIKQARLLKRWAPLLESGSTIENANTKTVLAQVLENTYSEFARKGMIVEHTGSVAAADGAYNTNANYAPDQIAPGARANVMGPEPTFGPNGSGYMNGNAFMPNVIMPMLRRIFPDLIANELVGVQAMNGPVGIALALRAQYNDKPWNAGIVGEGTLSDDAEIGLSAPNAAYTGKVADLDDEVKEYLGDRAAGEGADVEAKSEFASFSQGTYPTASFGLVQRTVTAKTRKLGGQWSPELAEDMEAVHGLDVENEMVNILSYEIGAEIDRQILAEMFKAAFKSGRVVTWKPELADGLDQMGRLATLLTQITVEANMIALRTRRGAGNFVVASPKVCAVLEQLGMNKFVSFTGGKAVPSVPYSGAGALQKVGLINDGCQLLVRDAYSFDKDYALVGYKGAHPGDSGIVYCPYIPVQMSKAINPDTMTPVIGCRTRYGIMESPWDSGRYYSLIKVEGLTEKYQFTDYRTFLAK